jgi:hypothetical protein
MRHSAVLQLGSQLTYRTRTYPKPEDISHNHAEAWIHFGPRSTKRDSGESYRRHITSEPLPVLERMRHTTVLRIVTETSAILTDISPVAVGEINAATDDEYPRP